jgi:hypothetical protein
MTEMQNRALIEELLRGICETYQGPGRPVPPLPESAHDVRVVHAGIIVRAAPFHDRERDTTAWQIEIQGEPW